MCVLFVLCSFTRCLFLCFAQLKIGRVRVFLLLSLLQFPKNIKCESPKSVSKLNSYRVRSIRYGLPSNQGNVEAKLVIPLIAPAAVSFAQFCLFDDTGYHQRDGLWIQLVGSPRYPQHLLHLGYYLVRFAVAFLMMDATERLLKNGIS